jgi:uncharacterized protein (DUF885 family)
VTDLVTLADRLVDVLAEEDPLNELLQGYPGYDHLLSNVDEDAEARLRDRALAIAAEAAATQPTAAERVTRGVIVQQAEAVATRVDARLIEHTLADYEVAPVAVLFGRLPKVVPERDEPFLARLAAIPEYLAAAADRHRAGVTAGRLPVASRARAAIALIDTYLADPAHDPLRLPSIHDTEALDRLLAKEVHPAFAAYRRVLHAEITPHGRPDDHPGLCWLPDGTAVYAALARTHTTTDRTPEELHQTGLELIERLAEEYVEIGGKAFGLHTVTEVHHRMRTDPALRWGSAADLLAANRAAMDRAEAEAPNWIGRLPEQRCGLAPVPELEAPTASSAAYGPGPLDGSRPGTFYVNTYRATERDRCITEANAFHEGTPGHHVQITLAQQLQNVPLLRRVAWINPYMEGWALYCERLADEMGLYSDDIARLGMLANDSMRAARLVVDTGLHHFGWSRERVVEFLRDNTVMSEVEIQSETDRYIEWPGQALSYMVGRLELQRLRARAEAAGSFDIKEFHDRVLGSGPLPMPVLDEVLAG